MACRIRNIGKHTLCLDLRGGESIYISPGASSPPLEEELLYDNVYLKDWLKKGLALYESVKLSEGLAQQPKTDSALTEEARTEKKVKTSAKKTTDVKESNDKSEKKKRVPPKGQIRKKNKAAKRRS